MTIMTKSQLKKKGNTYRKCISCKGYHVNPKLCPNLNGNHQGKKNASMPNFSRYRYFKEIVNAQEYDTFLSIYNHQNKSKHRKTLRKNSSNLASSKNKKLLLPQKKEKTIETIECPICLTTKGKWTQLGCNHKICNECYKSTLETDTLNDSCPLCRTSMFSENYNDYYLTAPDNAIHRKYRLIDSSRVDKNDNYDDDDSDIFNNDLHTLDLDYID